MHSAINKILLIKLLNSKCPTKVT